MSRVKCSAAQFAETVPHRYQQSAFALEELLLQVPQNSFFHLKYAETLYTAGEIGKAYKAYLRVLEMCQSDKGAGPNANGPWVRAVWGTKVVSFTNCTYSLPARSDTSKFRTH